MHWKCRLQKLKDVRCITCVHKAGARNSLIYLTGLETPDQQRWTEKEKDRLRRAGHGVGERREGGRRVLQGPGAHPRHRYGSALPQEHCPGPRASVGQGPCGTPGKTENTALYSITADRRPKVSNLISLLPPPPWRF